MSNWRSCNEGNPENEVDVLCFDERTGEQYVAQICHGGWFILSGVQIVHDGYDCYPTHWQPLPNSPATSSND